MPESATFQIVYDGPALANNSMDVHILAPALLAYGDLFEQANQLLHGDKVKVRLQVKALSPGSFDIIFQVIQNMPDQIVGYLTGDNINAAFNLVELIVMGRYCLLWMAKILKGKNPVTPKKLNNDLMRIEINGQFYDVPIDLLRLYSDISIRSLLTKVVEPLSHPGVEVIEIKDKGKTREVVFKDELPYFAEPTVDIQEETLTDSEREAAFSIISLAFKEDNKWRLFDGASTYNVTVKDQNFLDRVNHNQISFAKGDVLIGRLKTTQKQTATGLKAEYELLKVIDHKPAPPAQRQLFLLPTDEP